MGTTNASVLPEPVLAMPMQSRPDMMIGMHCACTASGFAHSCFSITRRIRSDSPHWWKPATGLGTSLPRSFISFAFRHFATSSSEVRFTSRASM